MNTTVSSELHLRLIVSSEASVPVRTDLRYDPADPYAVRAVFHTGDEKSVEWVFTRALLAEGMHQLAGTGDVGVWPSRSHGRDVVSISLSTDTGEALLEAPAHALKSFLKRTDAVVPPGTEHQHIDLDDLVVHLLADKRILRHVGVSCEECTRRHPVCVDGEPFGFLRRRHSGIGTYARHRFEAWLYAPDEFPLHRDGVHYVNTRASRDEAMADLAHWRSFLGRADDDLSPVIGVVADEEFSKYVPNVTEDEEQGFRDGALEVYGVGMLRPYPAGHRRRGQFYADAGTFTWGLIAPYGLEGIYTKALPASLAQYTPRL